MTKKWDCVILLLCAVSITGLTAEARARVGVLDFQANSISKSDAQVIGELFSSELVTAKFYDVVDRKNIEKLLVEQEFQLSDCTETSCAIKIGRVLALDYMIYGSVSKLGDTFVINVQLLNVATAQIEGSSKEKFLKIDEAIDILKKVVYQLAGKEPPADQGTRQTVPAKAAVGASEAPAGQVPAPARSWFLDLGVGGIIGEYESGGELEVNGRFMFLPQFGAGLGALLGIYEGGLAFGLNVYVVWAFLQDLGIGVGFKGFPEYINSFGGPTVVLYYGSFYLRLGIQVMDNSGWSIDVGYAL